MKLIRIFILLLILCSCTTNEEKTLQFREIKSPSKSVSPMIARWNNLNNADLNKKVDLFFKNHKKFPLIEKDSLYDDYLYITFIYRDTSKNITVEFDIFGNYDDRNLGDRKLKRLKNTGLFYRTYYMPNDICFSYRFVVYDTISNTKEFFPDPLNDNRNPTGEEKDYSWSVLDLRNNEDSLYKKKYYDVKSQLIKVAYTSTILKNTRDITVYLPEGYDKNMPHGYPTTYLFDSFIYLNRIEVPNVLDNMIREKRIEPMIAVFIDNPTKELRDKELPLNFAFKDFVVKELVPYIRSNWNVTEIPEKTIIGGMSYGGLSAGFCAFYHDSIFGNVLSQSGSFWRDTVIEEPPINWHRSDWLIKQFQTSDKKNIRFYLDWGLQEPIILNSNRKFTRVLDRLEYNYKFSEFNGWHDWSNSRKSFPVGLKYLMENK
ncbi:MAG: alpha/beta hydrolase-fold protein [Rikenellaceae bacterium]|nr:alpha/beta hydrolase-fold protein [Rikenellaceae bacterium]